MTRKRISRRTSPAPTPAESIPPVSPTSPITVKRYNVLDHCVIPRGSVMVFNNGGRPCSPYLQRGQRMWRGMVIESTPEYVAELIDKGKIREIKQETPGG